MRWDCEFYGGVSWVGGRGGGGTDVEVVEGGLVV